MKVSQTVPPTVQLHFNKHQHDQISSFETCFCAIRSKVSRTAPGCLLKSKTIWTMFKGQVQAREEMHLPSATPVVQVDGVCE